MFLSLQVAVDAVIREDVNTEASAESLPYLLLQRFPYPAHRTNPFYSYAALLLPICMMFSFMISILFLTKAISTDHDNGIKVISMFYLHVQISSSFFDKIYNLLLVQRSTCSTICKNQWTATVKNMGIWGIFGHHGSEAVVLLAVSFLGELSEVSAADHSVHSRLPSALLQVGNALHCILRISLRNERPFVWICCSGRFWTRYK